MDTRERILAAAVLLLCLGGAPAGTAASDAVVLVRVPGNEPPDGAEEHWLEGRGGVKVRVMTAPARGPARGSVIVAPGRTEFIEKYFEVLRDLQQRGFAVFCIDWRGQGLSGRETPNPLKGHLSTFDDPVNDLAFIGMIQHQGRSAGDIRGLSRNLVYQAVIQ